MLLLLLVHSFFVVKTHKAEFLVFVRVSRRFETRRCVGAKKVGSVCFELHKKLVRVKISLERRIGN